MLWESSSWMMTDDPQRYLSALPPNSPNQKSYEACASISAASKSLGQRIRCIIETDYDSAQLEVGTGSTEWHMIAMAHWGKDIYICDPNFDPKRAPADSSLRLHLEDLKDIKNLSRIIYHSK